MDKDTENFYKRLHAPVPGRKPTRMEILSRRAEIKGVPLDRKYRDDRNED